jgi:predicted metalloprotease
MGGLGMGGFGGRGLSIGGLLVVLVLGYLFTGDPLGLLGSGQGDDGSGYASAPATGTTGAAPTDPAKKFVGKVLLDTEKTWGQLFDAQGKQYTNPKLVLFDESVSSACGMASSAVGPFYCPRDRQVYIDLSFFRDSARPATSRWPT